MADHTWEWCKAKYMNDYTLVDFSLSWNKKAIDTREGWLKHLESENENIEEEAKEMLCLHKKYGYHDWYTWSVGNWGTKWNAWDVEVVGNVIVFQTAWAGVPELMLKLSGLFPKVEILFEFADEDYGSNLGKYVFRNGEIISEYEPEDESPEARQLAKAILVGNQNMKL